MITKFLAISQAKVCSFKFRGDQVSQLKALHPKVFLNYKRGLFSKSMLYVSLSFADHQWPRLETLKQSTFQLEVCTCILVLKLALSPGPLSISHFLMLHGERRGASTQRHALDAKGRQGRNNLIECGRCKMPRTVLPTNLPNHTA